MKIVVSGTSGLIGSALVPALRAEGHEALRLVRREPGAPDEVRWDPAGSLDAGALAGVQAAVHLAAAGVGDRRWTAGYKREIRESRVRGTATLSTALAQVEPRPTVLLCGSAIGFYGDTGDRAVDETAPPGDTFLAGVCRDWEAATAPAEDAGIRVAHLRTGTMVLGRAGGALARMLPIFKAGLGGPLGSGRQYWSWISLEDEVRAIAFLLTSNLSGPVNLTGPQPATNREVTQALARALHRPALFPVPPPALRIAIGELAKDVLGSQRVLPRRLLEAGFSFRHPDVDAAIAAALAT